MIGFGININQTVFDASLKNPVSLKQITAKDYDIKLLAEELCSNLQNRFEQLRDGKKKSMLAEYNNALYRKNMITKFKAGPRNFSALVKCVDEHGRLIIGNTIEESFEFGEIEWIID